MHAPLPLVMPPRSRGDAADGIPPLDDREFEAALAVADELLARRRPPSFRLMHAWATGSEPLTGDDREWLDDPANVRERERYEAIRAALPLPTPARPAVVHFRRDARDADRLVGKFEGRGDGRLDFVLRGDGDSELALFSRHDSDAIGVRFTGPIPCGPLLLRIGADEIPLPPPDEFGYTTAPRSAVEEATRHPEAEFSVHSLGTA